MNIKRIVTILLHFIIVISISLLIISFSIKDILVNGVIKETIKSSITISNFKESNSTQIITTNNDEVNKILQSREVQELMNKYLDKIINDISSDKEIDNYEIEKDIINYLKNNKGEIEKITGKKITKEQIEQTEELYRDNHISRSIENSIKDYKDNITTKEKTILKGYSFVISNTFRIIMTLFIIINLLLIALINKKIIILIESLGKTMLLSGIINSLIGIISGIIIRSKTGIKTVNTTSLIIISIIIATIGLIITNVYYYIKSKRSEQNEISQISKGE